MLYIRKSYSKQRKKKRQYYITTNLLPQQPFQHLLPMRQKHLGHLITLGVLICTAMDFAVVRMSGAQPASL